MPTNTAPPPIRAVFAKRLKALRIPRGYPTARSFAVALEIDENRYTRYERAEVEPDLSLLVKMCALLGVSPNDLLDVLPQPAGAPGFAEEATTSTGAARDSTATARRRALAWQLAEEIDKLDLPPAAHALDKVARVSKMFADIYGDPFSFLARFTAERRFDAVNTATAASLGSMIDELIEATKDQVLGARQPGSQ